MAKTRQALGRGLSALIPTTPDLQAAAGPATVTPTELDVDRLQPNSDQPRTTMDETRLDELSRSIEVSGVIQPIVVRHLDDGRFEIVAGERRWRAAQRAGLHRVPVVVRDVADENLLQLALVENLQRENLNPIEEAEGYRQLIAEHGLTQDAVAQAVGKDRATVANYVRLLQLPSEVQAELGAGRMAMGHARALLGLDAGAQRRAAREVVARGLSVRETEALVRRIAHASDPARPTGGAPPLDVHTRAAQDRLRVALGTRVRIVRRGKQGRIEINFTSEPELQRLFDRLTAAS